MILTSESAVMRFLPLELNFKLNESLVQAHIVYGCCTWLLYPNLQMADIKLYELKEKCLFICNFSSYLTYLFPWAV